MKLRCTSRTNARKEVQLQSPCEQGFAADAEMTRDREKENVLPLLSIGAGTRLHAVTPLRKNINSNVELFYFHVRS